MSVSIIAREPSWPRPVARDDAGRRERLDEAGARVTVGSTEEVIIAV
ncbi:hypothetical protein [Actinomyces sp.]|nr:hypothetical protein [Actinomyces sp.]MDO4899481.1 hypothetical protein [Actinomyces sp.]